MSEAKMYEYTPDQVTQAFDEIIATIFSGITVEAVPKMLVVAGIEASGKTYLLEKSLLPTGRYKNYVRLYLTEYRKKHPQYAQIIKKGVLHAYEHTEEFVREVCAKIFAQAFDSKYNIIMESAFDSLDFAAFPPLATAAGYQFETHIVGCTQEFAHVSSIKRGLKSLDVQDLERFLTAEKLDISTGLSQAIILAFETAAKAVSGSQMFVYERGFGALNERILRAHSAYIKNNDGSVTTTTTGMNFTYSIYSNIIQNLVFARNDRNEIIKECHLALLKASTHAADVPQFVYNDLYAYLVRYVYR